MSQLPQLAAKTDIAEVRTEIALLRNDVTSRISDVNSKIDSLRNDMTFEIGSLRSDMADQESRLIKWMVGSLFVFATIIVTLG